MRGSDRKISIVWEPCTYPTQLISMPSPDIIREARTEGEDAQLGKIKLRQTGDSARLHAVLEQVDVLALPLHGNSDGVGREGRKFWVFIS